MGELAKACPILIELESQRLVPLDVTCSAAPRPWLRGWPKAAAQFWNFGLTHTPKITCRYTDWKKLVPMRTRWGVNSGSHQGLQKRPIVVHIYFTCYFTMSTLSW